MSQVLRNLKQEWYNVNKECSIRDKINVQCMCAYYWQFKIIQRFNFSNFESISERFQICPVDSGALLKMQTMNGNILRRDDNNADIKSMGDIRYEVNWGA